MYVYVDADVDANVDVYADVHVDVDVDLDVDVYVYVYVHVHVHVHACIYGCRRTRTSVWICMQYIDLNVHADIGVYVNVCRYMVAPLIIRSIEMRPMWCPDGPGPSRLHSLMTSLIGNSDLGAQTAQAWIWCSH